MMRRKLILFMIIVVSCVPLLGQDNNSDSNELDSLLAVLETEMAHRSVYDVEKELKLTSIKGLKNQSNISQEEIYTINNRLIPEYFSYSFDSSLFYIEENIDIATRAGNELWKAESSLHLAVLLSSSGRYKEAFDILDKINPTVIPVNLKIDYYRNYCRLYADLNYYALSRNGGNIYKDLYTASSNSLISLLDKDSDEYLDIVEKDFRDRRLLDKCREVNSKRLSRVKMGMPKYSMITFQRSLSYELENNDLEEKRFLILSAISDIRGSVKDNASLTKLALLLYREKQIDKAHIYINFSFEDAVFFNSRLRFIEISNILSLITDAYNLKSEKQKRQLKIYLSVISVLTVILLITVFYIYRQLNNLALARNELKLINSQLHQVNHDLHMTNDRLSVLYSELSESNLVKEQYIANFLNICSEFIDKLDSYRKMVKNMVMARKYEQLLDLTKSNDLIEAEIETFYKTFDNTFLNIYPDFVNQLNDLLAEDERIVLKKGELLNTELRIFALIRLGINDSSHISKLLRYSVNTIYNYRVKIKNKAKVPRDEFEEDILKINAYQKQSVDTQQESDPTYS